MAPTPPPLPGPRTAPAPLTPGCTSRPGRLWDVLAVLGRTHRHVPTRRQHPLQPRKRSTRPSPAGDRAGVRQCPSPQAAARPPHATYAVPTAGQSFQTPAGHLTQTKRLVYGSRHLPRCPHRQSEAKERSHSPKRCEGLLRHRICTFFHCSHLNKTMAREFLCRSSPPYFEVWSPLATSPA